MGGLRPPPPEKRSRDIEQETSTATNVQFFNLPQHTRIRILPRARAAGYSRPSWNDAITLSSLLTLDTH